MVKQMANAKHTNKAKQNKEKPTTKKVDTAYNKHAEAVAKAVRMREHLERRRKQKKQLEENAVKKFLHGGAFKTIVNRAVTENMEHAPKSERIDRLHKKSNNMLRLYAKTGDGASAQEQDMIVQAMVTLTKIECRRNALNLCGMENKLPYNILDK